MPSAVKWEAPLVSRGSVLTTQLNSLANDDISAVGPLLDNSVNLDMYGWLEINVNFASAPTDSTPTLDVALSMAADGTNYDDAPVTGLVQQGHLLSFSVEVRKISTAQRILYGPIPLPPGKLKFALDNQCGVAFPATGSTMTLYTNNVESQ